VITATTHDHAADATTVHLSDVSGLAPAMSLTISDDSNSETKTIVNVTTSRRLSTSSRRLAAGSVTIESPLQHSYAAGASIVARPQATTTLSNTSSTTTRIEATTSTIRTKDDFGMVSASTRQLPCIGAALVIAVLSWARFAW